jgi:hypothetical protein
LIPSSHWRSRWLQVIETTLARRLSILGLLSAIRKCRPGVAGSRVTAGLPAMRPETQQALRRRAALAWLVLNGPARPVFESAGCLSRYFFGCAEGGNIPFSLR